MAKKETSGVSTVLGLDLGANSVGWALLEFEGERATRVKDAGVRIFEAGTEGDIEQGKDESRGVKRRLARQQRRQTWRRARRLKTMALTLQRADLLPPGSLDTPGQRHDFFVSLDSGW